MLFVVELPFFLRDEETFSFLLPYCISFLISFSSFLYIFFISPKMPPSKCFILIDLSWSIHICLHITLLVCRLLIVISMIDASTWWWSLLQRKGKIKSMLGGTQYTEILNSCYSNKIWISYSKSLNVFLFYFCLIFLFFLLNKTNRNEIFVFYFIF